MQKAEKEENKKNLCLNSRMLREISWNWLN